MKLTDYVALFLQKEGIRHVFGLTGGAVVHLFDSVYRTSGMSPVFTHHEQAASLASQAYARITNNLGATFVTTGPGGTNAVTGLTAAWLDSIPCIYISGQTRFKHTTHGKPIRQIGSQGFNIVSLVTPITKYAVMISDPKTIKYHLQKAVYIARSGRPGPVWVDIPLDFQWAQVDTEKMPGFDFHQEKNLTPQSTLTDKQIEDSCRLIAASTKPLLIAGYGIRLAHAEKIFSEFISKLKIPFVSTWNASDILPTDHPLYVGRIGLQGQKGGNSATRESDLILSLGSHLCLTLTGLDTDGFAPQAKKIIVDIDPVELSSMTVKTDLAVQSDVKLFLKKLHRSLTEKPKLNIDIWRKSCPAFKLQNAIPAEWKKQKKFVNHYVFIDQLSDMLDKNDSIVVDGGGTVVFTSMQAFKIKQGQRMILSTGICAMGTGLPESIGACFANDGKRTICVIGDGSMQLNVQELQTIIHHRLPIKIFVFNNDGYLSIRITQKTFLERRFLGSTKSGGMSLPDYKKVATAFGFRYIRINNHIEMNAKTIQALKGKNPIICEIMISPNQKLIS